MATNTTFAVEFTHRFACETREGTMNRNALDFTRRATAVTAMACGVAGVVAPVLFVPAVALAVAAVILHRRLKPGVPMFGRWVADPNYTPRGPSVNPSTGMIMVGGVDAGGNLYGAGTRRD